MISRACDSNSVKSRVTSDFFYIDIPFENFYVFTYRWKCRHELYQTIEVTFGEFYLILSLKNAKLTVQDQLFREFKGFAEWKVDELFAEYLFAEEKLFSELFSVEKL